MTLEPAREPRIEAETTLSLARLEDADATVEHIARHLRESGRDGMPVFALSREIERSELRDTLRTRWARSLSVPLWGRTWLLRAADTEVAAKRVIGHLELRGGRVRAELHRAVLGMGLQRAWVGRGHGRRLVEAALAWARTEPSLAYVDLGVFSTNVPAQRLYARAGFSETGRTLDAFRVDDGVSVDDIHMTLSLRP